MSNLSYRNNGARHKRVLTILCLIFLLASCQQAEPQLQVRSGDVLLQEGFDNAPGWDNLHEGDVQIGVQGSAYRMTANINNFVRGFNSTPFDNVVFDVEVTQFSREDNNAFGIVCRAVTGYTQSNGYYFLIGADGSYSIRKGQGQEIIPLIKWRKSGAIHKGAGINRIRAVCVEDYLALYINDQFMVDVRDSTYSGGFIGFAVATENNTVVDVAFDNLVVRSGEIIGQ